MATRKGGATMASPKERADQEVDRRQSSAQKITVRIDSLIDDPNRSLRAFASANIGDFAVHGIAVYEKDCQRWVNMPQTPYTDGNGEKKYRDIFHPTTAEAREQLGKAVLDGYKQHLENVQSAQQSNTAAMEAPVQKM